MSDLLICKTWVACINCKWPIHKYILCKCNLISKKWSQIVLKLYIFIRFYWHFWTFFMTWKPRDRKRGLVGKWMGKNLLSEILPFYFYAYIFFTLSLVRVRQQNYLGAVSKKYKHASNRNSPAEYPCISIDAQNRILWLVHELPRNGANN